jgi:cell division transport system ATP-binding protein
MQVIRFTGVSKSYPRGGLALRNVNLVLSKGEFVFLTGPSGAGKSTLLKLISMELRPTHGEVRVSGFSSARIHRREIPYLRRRLGIIFQDFRLLKTRTARENVAFALEVTGASREVIAPKVQRTLAAVGLAEKADRYPRELSGGEQQRVAIARALVNDPFILLADEPTGNLDTRTSLEILRLLRQINTLGMAVLLATHDYTLLRDYPEARVLHLENGAVVADSAAPDGGRGAASREAGAGAVGGEDPEIAGSGARGAAADGPGVEPAVRGTPAEPALLSEPFAGAASRTVAPGAPHPRSARREAEAAPGRPRRS